MKKEYLILSLSILLASIVLGGFYYANQLNEHKSIERQQRVESKKQEGEIPQKDDNKEFVRSITTVLCSQYKVFKNTSTENEIFENAYKGKEHVQVSIKRLEKWELSEDKIKKEASSGMIKGLKKLDTAFDAEIKIARGESAEENLAIFSVNLEAGRTDIMTGSSGIFMKDDKIELEKEEKIELVEIIENMCPDVLTELKDKSITEKALEAWATGIIYHNLNKE